MHDRFELSCFTNTLPYNTILKEGFNCVTIHHFDLQTKQNKTNHKHMTSISDYDEYDHLIMRVAVRVVFLPHLFRSPVENCTRCRSRTGNSRGS